MDDLRVISGIVHVPTSGGRWTDAPRDVYGPRKALYNRFVRRVVKGVSIGLPETPAQAGGSPSQVLIDSTAARAHCFRRIATRHDRLATNHPTAVYLAAAIGPRP